MQLYSFFSVWICSGQPTVLETAIFGAMENDYGIDKDIN